jgi:hypothetical protein
LSIRKPILSSKSLEEFISMFLKWLHSKFAQEPELNPCVVPSAMQKTFPSIAKWSLHLANSNDSLLWI